MKRKIKIEIDEKLPLFIADILCWLQGYLAGKGEYNDDRDLLIPAIDYLRDLNAEIKDKLEEG